MKKIVTIDDMLKMADELYEADFMAEAIPLYHRVMLRQEPSAKHLTLLGEAKRTEAMQFIVKLRDLYPDSLSLQLEWSRHAGLGNAEKLYSKLLNETNDPDIERRLHHLRLEVNCKMRKSNHAQMIEDFVYLWQEDLQKNQHGLVMTIQHTLVHTSFIPFLEQLLALSLFDDAVTQIIKNKIEFLRAIEIYKSDYKNDETQ